MFDAQQQQSCSIYLTAKCSKLSKVILCKPETLTLEHKRVPFDSHYPPEQKKTVEEVEETGVEAMQRDFSTRADNARYQAPPPSQLQCSYPRVGGNLGIRIRLGYR